jgi:hypothetical protein
LVDGSDKGGGAVKIAMDTFLNETGEIADSFFIRCIVGAGLNGGALYISGTGSCVVDRCCGISCWGYRGSYMYFESANLSVSENSIDNCSCHDPGSGEGIIYIGIGAESPVIYSNMSRGFAYDGSAIHWERGQGSRPHPDCGYCVCRNGTGGPALNYQAVISFLSWIFIDNSDLRWESGSLVTTCLVFQAESGSNGTYYSCWFRNNGGYIGGAYPVGGGTITFFNCLFDTNASSFSILAPSFVGGETNYRFNFDICDWQRTSISNKEGCTMFQLCTPSASRVPTPSQSPTQTRTRSPSPTPSRSPTPSASRSPNPSSSRSPGPTESRSPTPTASRSPTPSASRSPGPTYSKVFSPSDPFSTSLSFSESSIFPASDSFSESVAFSVSICFNVTESFVPSNDLSSSLSFPPASQSKKNSIFSLGVIIGIAAGGLALILGLITAFVLCRKKRHYGDSGDEEVEEPINTDSTYSGSVWESENANSEVDDPWSGVGNGDKDDPWGDGGAVDNVWGDNVENVWGD